MRTRLGAFFQYNHRHFFALLSRQLLDSYGGGQASRAAADHDHVVFHRFAGAELGQDVLRAHENLAG